MTSVTVLVLGAKGTGKTSLIERLRGISSNYPGSDLDSSESIQSDGCALCALDAALASLAEQAMSDIDADALLAQAAKRTAADTGWNVNTRGTKLKVDGYFARIGSFPGPEFSLQWHARHALASSGRLNADPGLLERSGVSPELQAYIREARPQLCLKCGQVSVQYLAETLRSAQFDFPRAGLAWIARNRGASDQPVTRSWGLKVIDTVAWRSRQDAFECALECGCSQCRRRMVELSELLRAVAATNAEANAAAGDDGKDCIDNPANISTESSGDDECLNSGAKSADSRCTGRFLNEDDADFLERLVLGCQGIVIVFEKGLPETLEIAYECVQSILARTDKLAPHLKSIGIQLSVTLVCNKAEKTLPATVDSLSLDMLDYAHELVDTLNAHSSRLFRSRLVMSTANDLTYSSDPIFEDIFRHVSERIIEELAMQQPTPAPLSARGWGCSLV